MDIFVANYLATLVVLFVCGFIWMCKKNWAIPASIIVVLAFCLALLVIPPAGAEETTILNTDDVYVRVGVIEEIDEENVAHIRDGAGVIWLWGKEEDDEFEEDDIVGLLMKRTGNPDTILDDIIIKVYYGGVI